MLGWEGCKLTAYPCAAGVWTIGAGHTKGVKEGDTCTEEQAKAWLIDDIKETQTLLAHYVNVPVSEGEFVALVSLAFNVGVGALMK
ncbi:MAG TPA: lysozyme, partial [Candidatus Aphodousia faecalis]|nr:lysozyme [Candidatus Aphodousia faecalis]